jgi:DNA helicase HerA-like ATPase
VLGQLGNRVQHALRAFTPRDQKAVKSAATTLRANPKLNVETAITELGIGEALVSFLDDKGRPNIVERAFVVPPGTRIGAVTPQEREKIVKSSAVAGKYDEVKDRESAYEKLTGRVASKAPVPQTETPHPVGKTPDPASAAGGGLMDTIGTVLGGSTGPRGGHHEGALEVVAKSAARAIGSQVGRQIVRGVLGSIFGSSGRRR